MLVDRIYELIERMEHVRKLEQAEQNRRELEEAEERFRELAHSATDFVASFAYAREELRFVPSAELLNALIGLMKDLEEIPATGFVEKSTVQQTYKQFNTIKASMRNEWKKYYPTLTEVREILYVIKPFDGDRVENCLKDIDDARSWTADIGTLQRLAKALNDASKLIGGLNMDKEVVAFLSNVAEGRARVSDLSERILDWIGREKLENRISLRFVSS